MIDDKVSASAEMQESIRSVLTSLAYRSERGNALRYVDIVFAGTPEIGIQKWQEQVFDLTLVDSKFDTEPKDEKRRKEQMDAGFKSLPDYYARYAGVLAFQAMRALMRGKERYLYRLLGGSSLVLHMWSSLGQSDIQDILGNAGSIGRPTPPLKGKADGLPPPEDNFYLAKVPRSEDENVRQRLGAEIFDKLRVIIDGAVRTAAGPFSGPQRAERFVSIYKTRWSLPEYLRKELPQFLDGYLFTASTPSPYFDEIHDPCGSPNETDKLYFSIRRPKGTGRGPHDIDLKSLKGVVHIGPSSRDVGKPLAAIVVQLFPELANTEDRSAPRADEASEPLATVKQMELLYRRSQIGPPGDRRAAIEVPRSDKQERPKGAAPQPNGGPKRTCEAAATPLTGVSTVGLADAQRVLVEKCKVMLKAPFDRVVLKTVYLDYPAKKEGDKIQMPEWNGIQWPALQAQSHHRTRCLRSVGHPRTIWNTGVTALEMFTPAMLNEFLKACLYARRNADGSEAFGEKCEKLVVSLGSKYPKAGTSHACYRREGCDIRRHESAFRHDLEHLIWSPLFEAVFLGLDKSQFPVVEINVRHYLRENVAFHIGGDEYMSPESPRGAFSKSHAAALAEFGWWVEVVNKVATANRKRVILKFPFRSDIFAFIDEALNFCQRHPPTENGFGIQGICLINAFKSGVCEVKSAPEFSPAWYSLPWAWGDAAGREVKYQMSGEMLNASRNMLLFKLLNARHGDPKLRGLGLRFGGGVVSQNDLDFCFHPSGFGGARKNVAVQIGTWALLDFKLGTPLPRTCQAVAPYVLRNKARATGECNGTTCNQCVKDMCSEKAIRVVGRSLVVELEKCIKCGFCVDHCPSRNFEEVDEDEASLVALRKPQREVTPMVLADKCRGCTLCTKPEKSGCPNDVLVMIDAIADDGSVKQRATVQNERRANCTACGKCVEVCPCSAITLESTATPELLPRICYLLHERCVGCGKCSRSFYCDTFLDRRGGDLHPLIDPRNCTGCGLCAQICPTGALQLFSPDHVAVLISGPGERTELLQAMQIPHLTYDPIEDLDLFDWGAGGKLRERARGFVDGKVAPTKEQLLAWSIDLWSFRLVHDRLSPHSGFRADRRWKSWIGIEVPKDLATEHMARIKEVAAERATSLIRALEIGEDPAARKPEGLASREIVALRAFVWSQLIWSDPGQVLWKSPIIVARTTVRSMGLGDAKNDLPYSAESVKNELLGLINDNDFSILNDWVVLRCGEVQKEVIDTPAVRRSEIEGLSLRLSADQVAAYADAGFGKGRLLGLDLRACPEMLGRKAERLDEYAIMSVSGLPWHDMRDLPCLKGIEVERDKRLAATRMLRP